MALDQRRYRPCQAPAVSSIGGGVILLIDGPPTPRTGEGQFGAGQLQQEVPPAAQCLDDRIDQAAVAGALADLGVLVQEAVGNQRHFTRRILLHWFAPVVDLMIADGALRALSGPSDKQPRETAASTARMRQ